MTVPTTGTTEPAIAPALAPANAPPSPPATPPTPPPLSLVSRLSQFIASEPAPNKAPISGNRLPPNLRSLPPAPSAPPNKPPSKPPRPPSKLDSKPPPPAPVLRLLFNVSSISSRLSCVCLSRLRSYRDGLFLPPVSKLNKPVIGDKASLTSLKLSINGSKFLSSITTPCIFSPTASPMLSARLLFS